MCPIDKEGICCEHSNLKKMEIPEAPGLATDQKGALREFFSVDKTHYFLRKHLYPHPGGGGI